MRVYRHFRATTDIEKLNSKYRGNNGVKEQIHQFERLLSNDYTHGHERYPNLRLDREGAPASIWKARVHHPQLGGKRSGLRYVYERFVVAGEEYAVALTIYVHPELRKESDVQRRIRDRFADVEATPDGIRRLEAAIW